jgi:transposase-like protein
VQRLWGHGCTPENGLQLVVRDGSAGVWEAFGKISGTTVAEQRCVCRILHNVSKKARTERKGNAHQQQRTHLMEQAADMYQAETARDAQARQARWSEQWREQAPQSVATLERDVAHTLVFDGITGRDVTWIRTTSLWERTNREGRRMCRQAVTCGSLQGTEVALSLHVRRLHARWRGETWWEASQEVFFDLKNLHP